MKKNIQICMLLKINQRKLILNKTFVKKYRLKEESALRYSKHKSMPKNVDLGMLLGKA